MCGLVAPVRGTLPADSARTENDLLLPCKNLGSHQTDVIHVG